MKKKTKGKTPHQIKLEQAHQRNLYLQKLKSVMDLISSEPAYHLLRPADIINLYFTRLRPPKLKFQEINGLKFTVDVIKAANDHLTRILKQTLVTIDDAGTQINSYDFYTFVETIFLTWRNIEDDTFPNARKFLERFPLFTNGYTSKRVDALMLVDETIKQLGWMYSHIPERIVWTEPEDKQFSGDPLDNACFYNNYLVHVERPESEVLDIDGNKRSIFRIGIGTKKGVVWLSVTPEKLGRQGILNKFPLKVYIQKHAIERIRERLGDFFHKINFFLITAAIMECEVYPAEGDSILFLCKSNSFKVGYLKASIIGDKVLIRTFLFLTNNGTPEGKKLESLLGIQKEDKKYLGIDKLNVFITSDIEQNENLKTIFCQAGCGDLFQIKKHLSKSQDQDIQCADYFSKYLGLENPADPVPVNMDNLE